LIYLSTGLIDSDVCYDHGQYSIIYNEKAYERRILFTLAHEIGHIWLDHLRDFELTSIYNSGLPDDQYDVLEKEADTFAAELLMPRLILQELRPVSRSDLFNFCGVSMTAAETRLKILGRRKNTNLNELNDISWIKKQFKDYLKPITICSNSQLAGTIKRCYRKPWRLLCMDDKVDYVQTENGRYTECPRCGNNDFSNDANFCKICGLYLYNICFEDLPNYSFQCRVKFRVNPGDARFC
jgi:Zn-dependent peptidase ImmA (M78 family)